MLMIIGIALIVISIMTAIYGISLLLESKILKGILLLILTVIVVSAGIFLAVKGFNSESFKRWTKDIESEYNGGLYRIIQVVNKDGDVIKEYKGKMDIQENSGEKLVFVMDGKKYIIYNSVFNTVFVEESDEEQN